MEARKEKKEAEEAAKRREKEEKEAAKAAAAAAAAESAAVSPTPAEPLPVEVEEPVEEDARMTKEQLQELAEALSILTAKSSIVKERDELKALLEDNLISEAVSRTDLSSSRVLISGIETARRRARFTVRRRFQASPIDDQKDRFSARKVRRKGRIFPQSYPNKRQGTNLLG